MHTRSFTKVAAFIAGTALVLTGCAATTSTAPDDIDLTGEVDYTGSISILTKFGATGEDQYFIDIAQAYEKLHPDVTVELIQETDQSIKNKTKTLTASQALPDIYFTWSGNWASDFIRGGRAIDLTDVIAPGTEWGDTFGEASVAAFAQGGKYYGIPLYNNGKLMGYNMALFDQLGLEEPATFEDLLDTCAVIKDAGYEPIAFGNKDGWPGLHYLQQLFAYNVPADVMAADFDPETATWDDPGYEKSLNEFVELVDQCTNSGDGTNGLLYSTARTSMLTGESAMYYSEILEFDAVLDEGNVVTPDTFGMFPLPAPADAAGDPASIQGAPEGYFVNPKAKNPALAVDFMKFVTNMENASTLSTTPYSQPSTVIGAVNENTSSKAIIEGIDLVNDASRIVIWLDTVTVPEVADAWLAGGQALVSGTETADEVLDRVRAASESAK